MNLNIKNLGIDQIKWLNKYHTINLDKWRLCNINENNIDWVYIGEWDINKENYYQRKENILNNKYHYWPKEKPFNYKETY